MAESRIFRTYRRRIAAGELTMAQCRQVVQVANGGGHRTSMTFEENVAIRDLLEAFPVRLPERDDLRGRQWLAMRGLKDLGVPEDLTPLFGHFTFDGSGVDIHERCAVPVWTMHLTDGRALRYWTTPWQALAWDRPIWGEVSGWKILPARLEEGITPGTVTA